MSTAIAISGDSCTPTATRLSGQVRNRVYYQRPSGLHLGPYLHRNDTGRHATPGRVKVPLSLRFASALRSRYRLAKVEVEVSNPFSSSTVCHALRAVSVPGLGRDTARRCSTACSQSATR
jgi:hypothetical protein